MKIRSFISILVYIDLGNKNGGIDFEIATKLSGARFVVLKNNFALLERALINVCLIHIRINLDIGIPPPVIVNEEIMFGQLTH